MAWVVGRVVGWRLICLAWLGWQAGSFQDTFSILTEYRRKRECVLLYLIHGFQVSQINGLSDLAGLDEASPKKYTSSMRSVDMWSYVSEV